MYSDIKTRTRPILIMVAIILIILIGVVVAEFKDSGRDLSDESAVAIREAVRKGALQCYVVEGVYPPNLEYLENNYGLKINKDDYYVTYDAFASNLPPEVIVTPKSNHGRTGDLN